MTTEPAADKRRQSETHPCFPQPEDRSANVWRYLSWPRFMNAITTGTLWFARPDKLGDPAEGSRPLGDAIFFKNAWDALKASGKEHMIDEVRASWRNFDMTMRRSTYVSCWQMKNKDAMQMWERYCGPEKRVGIAIQSTYERLDAGVPRDIGAYEHVMMGCVTYGDYEDEGFRTQLNNGFAPLMIKKIQYADEHEVRLVLQQVVDTNKAGIAVPVEFKTIVETVVISPYGAEPFRNAAERFCRDRGLRVPVIRSKALEVLQVF